MWVNRLEYHRAMRQILMAVEGSMVYRHRYLSSAGFPDCTNQLGHTGLVCTFSCSSTWLTYAKESRSRYTCPSNRGMIQRPVADLVLQLVLGRVFEVEISATLQCSNRHCLTLTTWGRVFSDHRWIEWGHRKRSFSFKLRVGDLKHREPEPEQELIDPRIWSKKRGKEKEGKFNFFHVMFPSRSRKYMLRARRQIY